MADALTPVVFLPQHSLEGPGLDNKYMVTCSLMDRAKGGDLSTDAQYGLQGQEEEP